MKKKQKKQNLEPAFFLNSVVSVNQSILYNIQVSADILCFYFLNSCKVNLNFVFFFARFSRRKPKFTWILVLYLIFHVLSLSVDKIFRCFIFFFINFESGKINLKLLFFSSQIINLYIKKFNFGARLQRTGKCLVRIEIKIANWKFA